MLLLLASHIIFLSLLAGVGALAGVLINLNDKTNLPTLTA